MCIGVERQARAALRTGRTLPAVVVAVVALLVAACGSSPSPSAGGSTTSASGVAYSACMRSHGVPNFPDPDSSGQLPKGDAQQFGVSTSQYQTAQQTCRHLLPTGGSLQQQEHQCMQNSDCPAALVQQMLVADRKLARCMRSHGVPSFPDPTADSDGPVFNITKAGRWPTRPACAPTAYRTSPTSTARECPARPTRNNSASAVPITPRPSRPASTCFRRAGRSDSGRSSVCCSAMPAAGATQRGRGPHRHRQLARCEP
jgi:hypothetical protein